MKLWNSKLKQKLEEALVAVLPVVGIVLAYFVPADFRAVAFDSGGVTTGPMTVPFIMALGVGISSIRNDRNAADDSFGLVALCSVGPILAVLTLGMIFRPSQSSYTAAQLPQVGDSVELWQMFTHELPTYMGEIAISLLPIIVFFGLFQIFSLRLTGRTLSKILIGLVYTYVGLVLFLTGAIVFSLPVTDTAGMRLMEVTEEDE